MADSDRWMEDYDPYDEWFDDGESDDDDDGWYDIDTGPAGRNEATIRILLSLAVVLLLDGCWFLSTLINHETLGPRTGYTIGTPLGYDDETGGFRQGYIFRYAVVSTSGSPECSITDGYTTEQMEIADGSSSIVFSSASAPGDFVVSCTSSAAASVDLSEMNFETHANWSTTHGRGAIIRPDGKP